LSAQSARSSPTEYLSGAAFLSRLRLHRRTGRTPLDSYSTFKIEAKFNFTKPIRHLAPGPDQSCAARAGFRHAVHRRALWLTLNTGEFWWLWAALFMIAFQFLMLILYPMLMRSLFNKF